MEQSPFLHPGFIVPVVLGLIGFIAWLIRLESKVNSMEKSAEETSQNLEKHRNNNDVHFNPRLATEVEHRQSDRMSRMESDIHEIKTMVKEIKNGK